MNIEKASFLGLLVLVTIAFFALVLDFLEPVFWATALAVIFHPLHMRIVPLVKGRNTLASFLTLFVIIVTVLIPSWFIASAVVNEAITLYTGIESGEIDLGRILNWTRESLPFINNLLDRVGISPQEITANISAAVIASSRFVGSWAVAAGQNVVRFAVLFLLMIYVLFFFIRDGSKLLETLIVALPFGDDRERQLLDKFAEVARALVKGTLVIAIVQGALGGLIFWVVDIQGAVFWGVVMAILSLVPVVGAVLVWLPAALFLMASGELFDAAILFFFGAIVISLADNVLRPILIGRDTRMPDYLVLLSTLGGITVFGASGFAIGPVIAALFLTIWVMFAEEHSGRSLQAFLDD